MGKDSARFWDRIAKRYAASPVADEAAYEKKLQITQGYFTPESEVLEFGCGTGTTAVRHAPHVKHIRAIDVSERMLEIARGKAAQAGVDNVSFERADIDALAADGPLYDAVLGMSILHLVPDRRAVIGKVFSLLKPGGVFVSSTATLGENMGWIRFIAPPFATLGLIPALDVMTPAELTDDIEAAGFEIACNWQPKKGAAVFVVAIKPS